MTAVPLPAVPVAVSGPVVLAALELQRPSAGRQLVVPAAAAVAVCNCEQAAAAGLALQVLAAAAASLRTVALLLAAEPVALLGAVETTQIF